MSFRLKARLAKLEVARVLQVESRLVIQIGRLKKLPKDYQGERHVATVAGPGRDPANPRFRFEERPGPEPPSNDTNTRVMKVCLVSPEVEAA